MAGFKETPRQKMIGMMYLVLTALLALNVSADLLNAFVIVNKSIEKTTDNFKVKNDQLYMDFKAQYDLKPDKNKVNYDKAMLIKKLSDALISQIYNVQNRVIGKSEFNNSEIKTVNYTEKDETGKEIEKTASEPRLIPLSSIQTRSDWDRAMEILLGPGSENGTNGDATKLKNAIIKYKKEVANLMSSNPKEAENFEKSFGINLENIWNPNSNTKQNWEMNSFSHSPLAADMILLNKLVADVRNIESESVGFLYNGVGKEQIKFDNIAAKVIPTSGTVLIAGQKYEADFIAAAYSTTDIPTVYIQSGAKTMDPAHPSGTKLGAENVKDGIVHYEINTGGLGEQFYAGVIQITKDNGEVKNYPFSSSYMVIKPTSTLSADKMNVLYKGLQNPLSVSAPGFTNDKITVSAVGPGTLKSIGNGKYEYNPNVNLGEVNFTVIGKGSDGKTTNLGVFKYRIKPVPSPTTRLSGMADGGTLDRALLTAKPVVTCLLENFLFDGLQYTVTSFELQVTNPKKPPVYATVTGSRIPDATLNQIAAFPVKSKITISNVKTQGPSGPSRGTTISLTLN